MKKVLLVLSLLAIFIIALSMKTSEKPITKEAPPPCWISIGVSWSGACTLIDEEAYYEVTLNILNTCNQTGVFNEVKKVLPPTLSTKFCIEHELCTIDQAKKCFKVTATVKKIHLVTGQVLCSGHTVGYYNCEELMGLDNTFINVALN